MNFNEQFRSLFQIVSKKKNKEARVLLLKFSSQTLIYPQSVLKRGTRGGVRKLNSIDGKLYNGCKQKRKLSFSSECT